VPTGRTVGKPLPHPYWVLDVAFSPDGHVLATACRDGALRLWNPSTGRQVGRPFASRLAQANAIAFSPTDRTLAAGYGNSDIALWDVKTHREIGSPQPGASGQVMSVAFAPDGKTLASAGDDGTIKFWRTADFGATFAKHGLPAVTAPAAPLASTIAGSPSSNRTASTAGSSAVLSVDFSPDGRALAAGTVDGPVEIFDAPRGPHWAKPIGRPSGSSRSRRRLAPEGHTGGVYHLHDEQRAGHGLEHGPPPAERYPGAPLRQYAGIGSHVRDRWQQHDHRGWQRKLI
jgi:WD40 repeat protein